MDYPGVLARAPTSVTGYVRNLTQGHTLISCKNSECVCELERAIVWEMLYQRSAIGIIVFLIIIWLF